MTLTSHDCVHIFNHPKDYVIVTSHRSEVSNEPSSKVIRMSYVGVVETYLYENVDANIPIHCSKWIHSFYYVSLLQLFKFKVFTAGNALLCEEI